MEFWPDWVEPRRPIATEQLAKVKAELAPTAVQPVAENRPAQAKRKRLGPAVPARRWDRLALAFFAPARQLSIPWRD